MQVALRQSSAFRAAWLLPLLAVGCARWHESAKLTLPPLQTPPNSVALEIVFAQFPFGDAELNGKLWTEIDEQELTPEVRQHLDANGFRAGVTSGQLPAPLEQLLKLTETPPAAGQEHVVDVRKKPAVHGLHKQTQSGEQFRVISAGEKERLPTLTVLLRNENGEVQGNTYSKVQCLFEAKAFAQSDGRVRLELLPQIEHGESRQQFVQGDNGAYQFAYTPPRENYEKLRLEAQLSPGQMLVIGCLPERLGSLGYHYFTEENTGRLEQKLILIRVANSGTPDATTSPGVSPLQEAGSE